MTVWLTDTFVWTGLLIAAVLFVRRPVARHFGPQVAYALWALPLLRFVLPPVVLPAWLAPAQLLPLAEPASIEPTTAAGTIAAVPDAGFALADLALPIWLGGAVLFLAWRMREYLAMRRALLADSRPVGEAGRVRLVETPAVASPIAFGVLDKVVALPLLFMSHQDRNARDLAILHELEHHRAHDLVANFAAQPLLALHWFNPLAWWGWRAMRRDQEAACDARVVAGRERCERIAYAQVIAGFAAGPNLALAASMACPVLGEKSIIHRLRSLTMSEVPSGRRKLGLAAIATTAIAALPLTASISYAQEEAREIPAAPAQPATPLAPARDALLDESTAQDEGRDVVRVDVRRSDEFLHTTTGPHAFPDLEGMTFDMEEFEISMEQLDRDLERMGVDLEVRLAMADVEVATAQSRAAIASALRDVPRVEIGCEGDQPVTERRLADGRQVIVICQQAIERQTSAALQQSRRALERSLESSEREREKALERLEVEIERIERRQVSAAPKPVIRAESKVRRAVPADRASAIRVGRASDRPEAPHLPVVELRDQSCPDEEHETQAGAWAFSA